MGDIHKFIPRHMEHGVVPYIAAIIVNPTPGSTHCKFQKGKNEKMAWKAYCDDQGVPSTWGYSHFQRLRRNVFGSTHTPPQEEVPQKGLDVLCFERIMEDWRWLTPELKKDLLGRITPAPPPLQREALAEPSVMENLLVRANILEMRAHTLELGTDRIIATLVSLQQMISEFHTDYFRIGVKKEEAIEHIREQVPNDTRGQNQSEA